MQMKVEKEAVKTYQVVGLYRDFYVILQLQAKFDMDIRVLYTVRVQEICSVRITVWVSGEQY